LAVKEANRGLKVGGVLIVSVPNPYYAWSIAAFVGREVANAVRRRCGRPQRLKTEVLSAEAAWDRHAHSWTPSALLTVLKVNCFDSVQPADDNPVPNRLRRLALTMLPFLGPTLILKVRKVAAAPGALV